MNAGLALGLAVAFGGALLLAGGTELQSQAVYRATGRWRRFLRSPRWLAGLLLLATAISTNFVALALAPVSVVQSVSIVALAATAAFGGLTGRVAVTRQGIVSIVLCGAGIVGVISVIAGHPAPGGGAGPGDLGAAAGILLGLTALGAAAALVGRRAPSNGVRLAGLLVGATVFGSITTVFKTAVETVREHGFAALAAPVPVTALAVVTVGGAVANVLLQRSHRFFPAPVAVAAITIVDPLTAAVIGITVLGEAALTATGTVALLGFGAIACLGVVGVSRLRRLPRPAAAVAAPPLAPRRDRTGRA